MFNRSCFVMLSSLFAIPQGHADRRAYGVTYEAVTAPKGELDVETWSTYARLGGATLPPGACRNRTRQLLKIVVDEAAS